MMKKIYVLLLFVLITGLSCKKTSYDPGKTSAEQVANGWWVTVLENGNDIGAGYFFLSTYNSADHADSIWVDDNKQFWQFKVKAKVNLSTLGFSTENAQNNYYDSKVTIVNGKVLPKAGHSASGVVADSIYMEVHFDDDPDLATWTISGTSRTGLIEDDH